MFEPALTGSGESVLVTTRSAAVLTVVVAVAVSFTAFKSTVVEVTLAVFEMVPVAAACTFTTSVSVADAPAPTVAVLSAPFGSAVAEVTVATLVITDTMGVDALTFTTRENVAVAPDANVAMVAVTVPVPPTAGVVSENAGPAVCIIETNVVFAGIASVNETLDAGSGPALVSVIVYVRFVPATTGFGAPLFNTLRSAFCAKAAIDSVRNAIAKRVERCPGRMRASSEARSLSQPLDRTVLSDLREQCELERACQPVDPLARPSLIECR